MAGINDRALAAYRRASGNPNATISTPLPYFQVAARRLSAATPVRFTGEIAWAAVIEVNNLATPTTSIAVFHDTRGFIVFRMYDMADFRFYGECDIVSEALPTGATFQPQAVERVQENLDNRIAMDYSKSLKRWCFVTNRSQISIPHIKIDVVGSQLPSGTNWFFRGLRLLPFRA